MVLWELLADALPWSSAPVRDPAALSDLLRRGDRPRLPEPLPAPYPEAYLAAMRAGMSFEVR
jgi:hypothetical protein